MLSDSLHSKTHSVVDYYNAVMILPSILTAKEVQIEGQTDHFTWIQLAFYKLTEVKPFFFNMKKT
jgi:protein-disulfide isomerase-like protein with CxxC motif